MRELYILAPFAIALLSCSLPRSPEAVEAFIQTSPPNASCAVSRGGNSFGQIDRTPGIVRLPNDEADYLISCTRSAYQDASEIVHVRVEKPELVEYLCGNAIRNKCGTWVTLVLRPR